MAGICLESGGSSGRPRYHLLQEKKLEDEDFSRLSADAFHFNGRLYLHLITEYDGASSTAYSNEIFRVESGLLDSHYRDSEGAYLQSLAPDEVDMNGIGQNFKDDDLRFDVQIWKKGEAHCCPSAGSLEGKLGTIASETNSATPVGGVRRYLSNLLDRENPHRPAHRHFRIISRK